MVRTHLSITVLENTPRRLRPRLTEACLGLLGTLSGEIVETILVQARVDWQKLLEDSRHLGAEALLEDAYQIFEEQLVQAVQEAYLKGMQDGKRPIHDLLTAGLALGQYERHITT